MLWLPSSATSPAASGTLGGPAGWLRAAGRALLRLAVTAVAGYVAWVLLMMPVYRFLDPPMSNLMLGLAWRGVEPHQVWVPLEEVSPHLVKAVVLSEDGQFCQHWGVDWAALRQAAASGAGMGASTITMQTVKNLFLWPGRNYLRKVLELPLAILATLTWSKRRTLEIYLNIAELGPGIYGVEAAARRSFGKPARALSAREAALIAASLPNPMLRKAAAPGPKTRGRAAQVQRQLPGAEAYLGCVLASDPPAE